MATQVCSVCDLPRPVYKCSRCGRHACTSHYSSRAALCEPCLRQEGRRVRRGVLNVFG